MKFNTLLLLASLPAMSFAQTQTSASSGVPNIAIPKVTAVLVIETPKGGVTFQQIMAIMPEEIQATGNSTSTGRSANGIRGAMVKVLSSSLRQRPKKRRERLRKRCPLRRHT